MSRETCHSHQYGVPGWLQGRNWRVPNCPACDAKLAAGKVTEDAPTPEQAFELYKTEKRERGQRASVLSRQAKARAAMAASSRESYTGGAR